MNNFLVRHSSEQSEAKATERDELSEIETYANSEAY